MRYRTILSSLFVGLLFAGAGCAPQSAQIQAPLPPAREAPAGSQNPASPDPAPQAPTTQAPAPKVDQKEETKAAQLPAPAPASVTIKMISGGFSPAIITVKAGTKVIFQNTDTEVHWVASNPHPTHTDLPGFDAIGGIKPGASYERVFTEKGTWRYHDHLNPALHGSITVE